MGFALASVSSYARRPVVVLSRRRRTLFGALCRNTRDAPLRPRSAAGVFCTRIAVRALVRGHAKGILDDVPDTVKISFSGVIPLKGRGGRARSEDGRVHALRKRRGMIAHGRKTPLHPVEAEHPPQDDEDGKNEGD